MDGVIGSCMLNDEAVRLSTIGPIRKSIMEYSMRKLTSTAILMATLSVPATAAESSFDYNYFGFSYGMQRIGVSGFSDEVAGHVFAADYSEEVSDKLIYEFHVDKTFSEDSIYAEDDQLRVDINEYNLHLGFGTYLPLGTQADLIGSLALAYNHKDNEYHFRMSGQPADDDQEEGSEGYLRAMAGLRLFIEPSRAIEISPRILTVTSEDETRTYGIGRASFNLYNVMEIYGEMTTDFGDDFRVFTVGANMHY